MGFLIDFLKLSSGTAFAQAINILAMPILARMFTPDDFGVAALFMSIIAIFGPIMCLRYELSIILPKSYDEAGNLVWLCILITTLLTFMSFVFIGVSKWFFPSPIIKKYVCLIPMALFLHGLLLVSSSWLTRKKGFGSLAVCNVIRPSIANCSKLLAGIQGYISGGMLIAGDLLGRGTQVMYLIQRIWQQDKEILIQTFKLRKLLFVGKRYKKFPLYSSWAYFLNTFSQQVPIILLAYCFNAKVTGFYVMARYIIMLPSNMIGAAISRVFFQKAASLHSSNIISSELVKQIVLNIFIVGIFPCLILIFFGKELMLIMLGPKWGDTGLYLQLLAPMSFIFFVSSPVGTLYSVYEIQEVALVLNVVRCIAHSSALFFGGLTGDVILTIFLFSVTAIMVRVVDLSWVVVKSNVHVASLVYICAKYLFGALLLIFPIYLVSLYWEFSWGIISMLIITCLSYYLVVIYRKVLPLYLGVKSRQ